jgi:hypothetical protein
MYLRSLFSGDHEFAPASKGLWGGVKGIMQSALTDYDNCVPVLRVITGISQIQHVRNLTHHTLMVLVGEWKCQDSWEANEDGQRLIVAVESLVEKHANAKEIEELYQLWVQANLPGMRAGDQEGDQPRYARSADKPSGYSREPIAISDIPPM